MNKEKVRNLVEGLDICSQGKAVIRLLIEEITGEKIKEEESWINLRLGQLFDLVNNSGVNDIVILCQVGPGKFSIISLYNGNRYCDPYEIPSMYHFPIENLHYLFGEYTIKIREIPKDKFKFTTEILSSEWIDLK